MPQTASDVFTQISDTAQQVGEWYTNTPWQDMAWIVAVAHALITLYLLGRILTNQRSTGVAVAWLVLLFALPIVGIIAYLLVGEPYLGKRYQSRSAKARALVHEVAIKNDLDFAHIPADLPQKFAGVANIGKTVTGFGVYDDHTTKLLMTSSDAFDALIADIKQASVSVYMEFYIVFPKGRVQEVFTALLEARERGVTCQILADSVGSFSFFTDDWHERLTIAGVQIYQSLPVGLFKTLLKRTDLRNHRKIVVIDETIGYTGSFNLVDPRFFKQDKNVGEWIDVLMRIESPHRLSVVSALMTVCLTDISAESQQNLQDFNKRIDDRINQYTRRLYKPDPAINDINDTPNRLSGLLDNLGNLPSLPKAVTNSLPNTLGTTSELETDVDPTRLTHATLTGVRMQVIPSAPQLTGHVIYNTLVTMLHRADRRIRITTPYFVPDEALLSALTTASRRGVDVTLIVPKKVDSFLVQHASQAVYGELLDAGVNIACFTGGLLHTKTVVIDDDYAIFGTVNMDLRSFYLNMELSLAIYTPEAVAQIAQCQAVYLQDCEWLDHKVWQQRNSAQRLFDAGIRLFSPLL